MKDLEVRLAALDPDAGAAIRVIGYFDQLAETGASLEANVRGAGSTQRRKWSVFYNALGYAVEQGHLSTTPSTESSGPPPPSPRR